MTTFREKFVFQEEGGSKWRITDIPEKKAGFATDILVLYFFVAEPTHQLILYPHKLHI